ncbi:isoprenylcysteine carboxylmethyltransferase family protein [Chryseomicrobium sp. FSL W7-1435]|uniref:isoprenylcysteine carboxyl methyltransferase family protein n=1 Tax=Chryseomicrobium sp. FSL W7-1435 TaxID=2921704 RepID=UPI003159CFEF
MDINELVFFIIFGFVIIQRIIELFIAKRNEEWIKSQGGYEVGKRHYPFMVVMHVGFFISLLLEFTLLDRGLTLFLIPLLIVFAITQLIRIWILSSLGRFWNTKIMILPGASVVKKGPFQFMRHPNYTIVALELLVIPLMFNAFITVLVFSLLNLWMLSVRIPIEEAALSEDTNYKEVF